MNLQPGCAQDPGRRKEQQDDFSISDLSDAAFLAHGGLMAAVADGMGGLRNGKQAARTAARTFLSAYEKKTPGESIPEAMERAMDAANRSVWRLAEDAGLSGEVGTTLAAAAVHRDRVYWLWAGDSRVYLWRDGALRLLSRDHDFGHELDGKAAAGEVSADEARNHPDRAALVSFLGLAEIPHVGRGAEAFLPGDRILLCSDGLYRTLPESRIAATMETDPPQAAAETLVREAIRRNVEHQDNLTVVVLGASRSLPGNAAKPIPPRRRFPIIPVLAAFLLGATLVGGGAWWFRGRRTDPPPKPFSAEKPVPTDPGTIEPPSDSPDPWKRPEETETDGKIPESTASKAADEDSEGGKGNGADSPRNMPPFHGHSPGGGP